MSDVSFTLANGSTLTINNDVRSDSRKFYDGYVEAIGGPLVVGRYQRCMRSSVSPERAGYLAGTKAKFGRLPDVEFEENGQTVQLRPRSNE